VAWRQPTETFVLSSLLIFNDRLYVGSTDRHTYCMAGARDSSCGGIRRATG